MLQTPTHTWHAEQGARLVDFAGWEMPVQYSTIVEEHAAVRTAAGLFDIAHMGRFRFSGRDAEAVLDRLLTNDVTLLQPGQIRYSLVTNETGGILDDVLVYRFSDHFLLVVNASNRVKIWDWIQQHLDGSEQLEAEDLTLNTTMVALQGPAALEIASGVFELACEELKYYSGVWIEWSGEQILVSRTGYTGEDGVEAIAPDHLALQLWTSLMSAGQGRGIVPAGLGCRDTLRLEAAMPLYGHELNEQIDPLTAGLGFAVKLHAGDFVGKEALLKISESEIPLQRVGLEVSGRRIAREHAAVMHDAQQVGEVTSGTFSPTLQKAIAMAYVPPALSGVGQTLEVDIRGRTAPAEVVDLPFYRRPRS